MGRWRFFPTVESLNGVSCFVAARLVGLPSTVSDTFRRQVAKSGLPQMRLHDARHTHITHLLRSGEPIQNVSARAGHGSSFTTLTTYAHVIAGDDERTAARAAGLFGD